MESVYGGQVWVCIQVGSGFGSVYGGGVRSRVGIKRIWFGHGIQGGSGVESVYGGRVWVCTHVGSSIGSVYKGVRSRAGIKGIWSGHCIHGGSGLHKGGGSGLGAVYGGFRSGVGIQWAALALGLYIFSSV